MALALAWISSLIVVGRLPCQKEATSIKFFNLLPLVCFAQSQERHKKLNKKE